MNSSDPVISVLICTFNRSEVLQRAISSVLKQDYYNFELVIIDDCSSDNTSAVVSAINDPRIRYYRNDTNLGSKEGDRAHVRRFVYELMRGQYFVYLCDDDYWVSATLLSRQVAIFKSRNDISMVIGGQLSRLIAATETPLDTIDFTTIPTIDFKDLYTTPSPNNAAFVTGLYEKKLMSSEEFLLAFSQNPAARNRIVGATLYSKKHFIKSGAMLSKKGSKWQAGYEFLMGPACYGGVAYFDQPEIVVEVRPENASFQRTQRDHYQDCLTSIDQAFRAPLADKKIYSKRRFLKKIKRETIRQISLAYLGNTISTKLYSNLTMCSQENLSSLVFARHVLYQYFFRRIMPNQLDVKYLLQASMPRSRLLKLHNRII